MIIGPFINDVSSKGKGGGHKIGKMSRHLLWMAPYKNLQLENCFFLNIFEHKYANTKK